ncbi:MAG TPA: Rne/Rng family ribonuclease [Pyrinomonadaceae bacterium]|nr:Rne/Rng family ribonuclease [Pyrinomonadaceae bacterium]
MTKELIVSVNGREKKIAIIENERVTEFYIERGEEHQGIVGNIYKGRVMRVLPGMQSAFVDIGLERDAFLYVSDFFDEEEEFERIVIDKTKKGEKGAERAAAEHLEQARIEREQRIEAAHERIEPLLEMEPSAITEVEDEALESVLAQPAEIIQTAAQVTGQAREAEGAGRRRSRRSRRRGKGVEEQVPEALEADLPVSSTVEPVEAETPFVAGGASFERVIDEDEIAAENGEMFKDARLQERIFDQIHAVEFDMEDVPTVEVGSLLTTRASAGSSFQRIDDSDMAAETEVSDTAPVQEMVAARVGAFIDEVTDEALNTRSFERISDEERTAEEARGAARSEDAVAEAQTLKRGRSRRAAKKVDEKTETADEATAGEADRGAAKSKGAGRKKAATKSAAKKSTTTRKTATKGRKRASSQAEPGDEGSADTGALETETASSAEDTASFDSEAADQAGSETDASAEEAYEDAEATVTSRSRAEFATRRGGRRRRRPSKHQEAASEDRSNGQDDEAAATEVEEADAGVAAASSRRGAARGAREDRHTNGRGQRGTPRRERQQPTIADLLREGQEVLVQIAKEPIAKKGARITSHIALPGRFIVYMPTVEHVGVSRKIESDGERARLRKLIQAIRAEEDVPSGGFIVRTAGVGISEEDLRDDARYLVRTWLDIRRVAEKTKAPALVHRDLDLVQRILRDQLSDEFTAIRVDSEEEYQRMVEFINRIQPRMVKRVKLYTRDEPILEAYGVQAEVDKAIKPRVWLRSGGYLVINQTEALVAIDVNTGKFVGRGGTRLEDTITRTNLEAVEEIVRQIRLRDLGGIIVLDLIDMEERRNRQRVMQALQEALQNDKSPTKVLSFNDFGLVIMTRKRVKQSLERTLCAPCPYCQGGGLVKSPQTICYEILEEARRLAKSMNGDTIKQTTLRVNPEVARALRGPEQDVLVEIEDYLGAVDVTSDEHIHQEQFDFAFI